MIKTLKDLKFYLQEDAKANFMEGIPYWKYRLKLFAGSESAHVIDISNVFAIVSIIAIIADFFIKCSMAYIRLCSID